MSRQELSISYFRNKHILITGASSGIGASLCHGLARGGAKISALARRTDRLNQLAQQHPSLLPLTADISDKAQVTSAIAAASAHHGRIDIAILNAGIYQPVSASDWSDEVFRNHMDVNYMGMIYALGCLVPEMLAHKSGHIALMASVAGYRGLPRSAAYGPSKAALQNLAESLYFDLTPKGVKIQLINPGFVKTEATAVNDFSMPGLIEADDAAERILENLPRRRFEISFPFGFSAVMKMLSLLPYDIYLRLVAKLTGSSHNSGKG